MRTRNLPALFSLAASLVAAVCYALTLANNGEGWPFAVAWTSSLLAMILGIVGLRWAFHPSHWGPRGLWAGMGFGLGFLVMVGILLYGAAY